MEGILHQEIHAASKATGDVQRTTGRTLTLTLNSNPNPNLDVDVGDRKSSR